MAINFPASPSVNDTFTVGSITYKCVQNNPTKWIGLGVTPADRLVEGSNSLEINATNDLVWTGDSVLLGTATANVHDRLTIYDPGNAFMSIRSDVAADDTSQVLDFGVGTADRSSANLTAIIEADIHSTSGGTLKADLVFATNAGNNISDKMRLTSDGNLGINQDTPTSQSGKVLHISGDSGGQARIHLSTSASGHGADEGHYICSQGAESGANAGQLAFINMENRNITFTTGSAGANATRLTIQHDGNLNIADGNLIVAAGHGIDFSATTNPASGMTSELLDDYEEGNYSPGWVNATGVNYIAQNGQYVRVGTMVYVWGEFQFSTFTSFPNGWDQISLPFAGTRIGSQTNSLSNNWWAVTSGGTGQVSGHLNFGPLGHPGEGNASAFTNTFLTGNNGMGNASIASIFSSSATTKTIRFHMCYTAQ